MGKVVRSKLIPFAIEKHKIKKNQKHESGEEEKEMAENEYNNNEDEHNFQKRLFSHQQSEKAKNTKAMPSCKRFWSVAEFNKLRPADRQPIQQEIIRTLVKFQKKAFYVFEERDERLKHFLLNSTCEREYNLSYCCLTLTLFDIRHKSHQHLDGQVAQDTGREGVGSDGHLHRGIVRGCSSDKSRSRYNRKS